MPLSFKKLLLVASVVSMAACSSHQSSNNSDEAETTEVVSSVFPIATSLQVSYQDEVKLLRINQLISEAEKVDAKQRALLLYERGLIYDRIGLTAHSRYDFTQSISLDPTLAESYNSLGVHLLVAGAYDEAFDAFDSAIELSDKMQYSYLHRAIGLYLVKRYAGAQEDIEHFYALDKNDPYRVLWRYRINYAIDPQLAMEQLKASQPAADDNRFAWAIIDVINGETKEADFFDNVLNGVKTNEELAHRLCEANYYLAHWHIHNNNISQGIYYLKLSIAANVKDFIEYKYALLDLNNIQLAIQEKMLEEAASK